MNVHKSVAELIGHTPLVELTHYEAAHDLPATLLGKVESFNPTGSVKDRAALAMIEAAEAAGLIDDETVLIEPTSGNTGIGLAALAAVRGNRIIITMPETMSQERRNLMRAYGAELVLTEGAKGMKGAIAKADELAAEIPNSFIPSQFTNAANPAVHERTTGPEIWKDTDGTVDILVAGVGTGGTISGTGAYLKANGENKQNQAELTHELQDFGIDDVTEVPHDDSDKQNEGDTQRHTEQLDFSQINAQGNDERIKHKRASDRHVAGEEQISNHVV